MNDSYKQNVSLMDFIVRIYRKSVDEAVITGGIDKHSWDFRDGCIRPGSPSYGVPGAPYAGDGAPARSREPRYG